VLPQGDEQVLRQVQVRLRRQQRVRTGELRPVLKLGRLFTYVLKHFGIIRRSSVAGRALQDPLQSFGLRTGLLLLLKTTKLICMKVVAL
jgi:hypothetical protein